MADGIDVRGFDFQGSRRGLYPDAEQCVDDLFGLFAADLFKRHGRGTFLRSGHGRDSGPVRFSSGSGTGFTGLFLSDVS